MKQRLLVMNGQRLVQSEQGGQWQTQKVTKAGNLKPGVYDIYLASAADKRKANDGLIVHVDQTHVYQQVGKHSVCHERGDFAELPEVGFNASIKYDKAGNAHVTPMSLQTSRRLSR